MLNMNSIRQLINRNSDDTLSLYLHVDPAYRPNQNKQPAWQIYIRNTLRNLASDYGDSVPIQAIHTHIESFLAGYTPRDRSLVLFADGSGIIEHYDLPVVVDNHHSFGAIDLVPLLWTLDEYERYLVVLVDREKARFLSAYLGRITGNDEMRLDFDDYDFGNKRFIHANHSGGGDTPQGSGGDNFADMKSEHIRRFHSDVAEQIRQFMENMQSERIILGGSERAAHQVKDLLHHTIRNQLVEVVPIPVGASDTEIMERIQDSALAYERAHELSLINEVIDLAKSGGRGVLGIEGILSALAMQQVELLVLPCPVENREMAIKLSSMALESGAEIEWVHGSAAARLRNEAGVAARLYYHVNQPEGAS